MLNKEKKKEYLHCTSGHNRDSKTGQYGLYLMT